MSKPDQVVVTTAGHSILAVHSEADRPRGFPEVQREGHSPADAAARLADVPAWTLDGARSGWGREGLPQAIEDVRAFVRRVLA